MKTIAAIILALSTSFGINAVAFAEPFNEGGVFFLDTVKSDPNTPRPKADTTATEPFNDRGANYIVDAPAGSASQEPKISQQHQAQGWNS